MPCIYRDENDICQPDCGSQYDGTMINDETCSTCDKYQEE